MGTEVTLKEEESAVGNDSAIAPGSAFYEAVGDPVTLLYGFPPALVNSVLIPKSARGVEQHERLVNGSIPQLGVEHLVGRIVDSIDIIFGVVFAEEEAEQAAYALHELHRKVKGKMPDGSSYQALNQQTWTNTWLVQVKGFMDAYGALRGFIDEAHRRDVYRGFVELGRRFRVTHMPAGLQQYEDRINELEATTLVCSAPARFLVEQTTPRLVKPLNMRWLPTRVWGWATLPVRRMARVGLLLGLPGYVGSELGIRRNGLDRLELWIHRCFWGLVPRRLAARFGPWYFRIRRRRGTPAWRTRYSAESLAKRRNYNES
ncbi:MAG: oxygenase MpaB family protein [Pseudomonadota bacterium]